MRPELINVLCSLSGHGYSISSLVEDVLTSQAYDLRDPLILAARDHLERKCYVSMARSARCERDPVGG
jgi:hypothetical protein